MSSWIYTGCCSCAEELIKNPGTTGFLSFIKKMLALLKYHEIKPLIVFDGQALESKNKTKEKRNKDKEENLKKAEEFKMSGDNKKAK